MDIQFILDVYACAVYIVNYLSKGQKGIVVNCVMGSDHKDSVKTQYLPVYIFYVFSVSFHVLYINKLDHVIDVTYTIIEVLDYYIPPFSENHLHKQITNNQYICTVIISKSLQMWAYVTVTIMVLILNVF